MLVNLLERYTEEEMDQVWSPENKFRNWLLIELAVLKVRQQLGELKYNVSPRLINRIKIDPKEIDRIEAEVTKHDVAAFLRHISPQLPQKLKSWFHRGLTSYDIQDTGLSLQLRESVMLILRELEDLMEAVKGVAMEHKNTACIGRTHLVQAEPITQGVRFANWYAELERDHQRLKKLLKVVSVGGISGAVGMYTLDPRIEELVCKELGLAPIITTQIISRDIIAEYMTTLGTIAATVGKIAVNIRLLSQTEIREIMEHFAREQIGSSAMPHKKNPIGSENITSLMRIVCKNAGVAYEHLANCWEERTLDNSGAERIIIPESSILLHYALRRLGKVIKKLDIFPEKMKRNLELTKGLIYSQGVMTLVANKSRLPREEAHTLVRNIALECWDNESNFLVALLANEEIMEHIKREELTECFNIENKLHHVDYIFKKVFGK